MNQFENHFIIKGFEKNSTSSFEQTFDCYVTFFKSDDHILGLTIRTPYFNNSGFSQCSIPKQLTYPTVQKHIEFEISQFYYLNFDFCVSKIVRFDVL
jgi:hypothetical protein